jgi:hypothetical protein
VTVVPVTEFVRAGETAVRPVGVRCGWSTWSFARSVTIHIVPDQRHLTTRQMDAATMNSRAARVSGT